MGLSVLRSLFIISLFILSCLHTNISYAASKAQKDLEMEVRYWSFGAVARLLTYDHDSLVQNTQRNSHLLTQLGCMSFLWTLDKYGLSDDLIKRKESIATNELWRTRTVPKEIMLVKVKQLNKEELKKRKERTNKTIKYGRSMFLLRCYAATDCVKQNTNMKLI